MGNAPTIESTQYDKKTNFTSSEKPYNILLDFDMTCTEAHSSGTYERDPMSSTNKDAFVAAAKGWISQGHNVAIITRGIDDAAMDYIHKKFGSRFNINPTANDFRPNCLSIYAPDKETFYENSGDDFWSREKTKMVQDFLEYSRGWNQKTIFIDDTLANVKMMKLAYPNMKCVFVKHAQSYCQHTQQYFNHFNGDYKKTFHIVDEFIANPDSVNDVLKGGKKRKTRKRTRKNKRKYIDEVH